MSATEQVARGSHQGEGESAQLPLIFSQPDGWGLTGRINMLRYFDPGRIPDTPGDIAARVARSAPAFPRLSQQERDRRVMEAVMAA